MDKYSIVIKWSDEDASFVATCPEFPGLSAFGSTKMEALAEYSIALDLFIAAYSENKMPLPPPQTISQLK